MPRGAGCCNGEARRLGLRRACLHSAAPCFEVNQKPRPVGVFVSESAVDTVDTVGP